MRKASLGFGGIFQPLSSPLCYLQALDRAILSTTKASKGELEAVCKVVDEDDKQAFCVAIFFVEKRMTHAVQTDNKHRKYITSTPPEA